MLRRRGPAADECERRKLALFGRKQGRRRREQRAEDERCKRAPSTKGPTHSGLYTRNTERIPAHHLATLAWGNLAGPCCSSIEDRFTGYRGATRGPIVSGIPLGHGLWPAWSLRNLRSNTNCRGPPTPTPVSNLSSWHPIRGQVSRNRHSHLHRTCGRRRHARRGQKWHETRCDADSRTTLAFVETINQSLKKLALSGGHISLVKSDFRQLLSKGITKLFGRRRRDLKRSRDIRLPLDVLKTIKEGHR